MPRSPRRRDRHGRGLRGPVAPVGTPLPQCRSPAEQFGELVDEALDDLRERWADQLTTVRVRVADVPELTGPAADEVVDARGVPLARAHRGPDGTGTLVVYRRPVELRAADPVDRADLVHEVVVEAVARLLGVDPATVDPFYGDDEGE